MNSSLRRGAPLILVAGGALWCLGFLALGMRSAGSYGVLDRDLAGSLREVERVLASSDRIGQAAALTPILRAMDSSDAEAIAAVFERAFSSGAGHGLALQLFTEKLSALDPLAARERILAWPHEYRSEALPILIRSWARHDPQAALEALNRIRDPKIQEEAFPAMIEGWGESGQPGVWRYLASLETGLDRERGTVVLLQHRIARGGSDVALREIEALPQEWAQEEFRASALRTLVGLVARTEPARATAIAESHRDDPEGGLLMRRVAVNWVTQDGAAAMGWLLDQPEGKQRDSVMREAYRRWVVRNRPAALAWLAARSDLSGLGAIVDIYATAITRVDPQAAIAFLERIEDPTRRRQATADVAEVWHHADPEASRAWIEAGGLLEELQRRAARRAALRERGRAAAASESPALAPAMEP